MADDDKGADTGAKDTGAADKGGADTGTKDAGTILAGADKGAADTGADKGAADDKGKATDTSPDWRARLAGDDKDFAKQLGRYSDEAAFGKAYRALQTKLSSGEFKKALPEGASAEELATWRKENGLPDKAEGYVEKLELPKGLIIGEADKPIVAEFAAAALEGNVDPKQFNGMVAKYYDILDKQRAAQEDADAAFKTESEEALRTEWQGPEFRRNLTAVNNLIATWSEGLATNVLAARGPDGRKLGDSPALIKQLAALAVELNPTSTLVPAGTTDPGKTVAAELESIRELRRNNPDEYAKNEKKHEAREIELIEAQLKLQKRNAA
jgi:hypothetical protein